MPVFDIEGDGLRPTKIHVLSYWNGKKAVSLTDYEDIKNWLLDQDILIGHNIQRFDIPCLERLLGIEIKSKLRDTLAWSWYLFPKRVEHGLESWGVEFGVPKPQIDNWEDLPIEEYCNRCEKDVEINQKLLEHCINYFSFLYECPKSDVLYLPIVNYLEFKLDCAREQERSKWHIDVDLCQKTIAELEEAVLRRTEALSKAMPKVPKVKKRRPPEKPFKKSGERSVKGQEWVDLMKELGHPEDWSEEVSYVASYEEPNPASVPQVKDWLFSLGWVPEKFKYEREDDGSTRAIPQIRIEGEEGKELCPSVVALAEKDPAILELEGLTVAQHRLAILKGFIENMDDEARVEARIAGLTNTLRFKHKIVVNLPGVNKPYGSEVRGCLVAGDGKILCGSDMSSLEDRTKRHYMYFHDPEYVEEMSDPDYDPHLDLAVFAKVIDKEDMQLFIDYKKWGKKEPERFGSNVKNTVSHIAIIRKNYKVVNYSATYGVGKEKLARETGTSIAEAKALLDAYWKRNWAIRKIAEECVVKRYKGQDWLYNPVSKFWYSLRADKDRFSTLNQGTGVFCFDSWVREIRKVRPQLTAQFHDEVVLEIKLGSEEKCRTLLKDCIRRVNEKLKLNVLLDVDVQFGHRYSDIH